MKNILFICLLFLCIACKEDRSVDPTVMPEITSTGANTFGCLIDGWVYTGSRWGTPTTEFVGQGDSICLRITAEVDFGSYIRFTLINPKQGETVSYTDANFESQSLEDGKALISRMDNGIISGTFEGSRMTKGRFDLKYKE